MVTANDLKGIMAMMPAFTTQDGDRIDATGGERKGVASLFASLLLTVGRNATG